MKWARYKLILISGIVTVILCGGLIFWILSSSSALSELDSSVDRLRQQQNTLVSSELYPSESNLVILRQEQKKVAERRDTLLSVIREGQLSIPTINRAVFGDYINGVVPELRQAASTATKGGEDGVKLNDPDFGLTEYLEGTLPTQRRINTLVVEIETIDHVAKLLFTSGISELVSINVKGEEDEETNPRISGRPLARERRPTRTTRSVPTPSVQEVDDGSTSVEKERERLFSDVVLRVEFKAYEDFLWEAVNQILADSNQLVISSFSITNGNTLLWPDYLESPNRNSETRSARRERRDAPRSSSSEPDLLSMLSGTGENPQAQRQEKEKLPGLAERQLNVVGGDLLNVVMEVKAFRLKPAEESAAQPEGI